MSRWSRNDASVGIGAHAVSLSTGNAAAEVRSLPWGSDTVMPNADKAGLLTAALRQLHATQPGLGRPAALVVTDSLAHHWVTAPPPGVSSFAELRALARAWGQQLFGTLAEWEVQADWHASQPFLCAAIPHWVNRAATDAWGDKVALSTATCWMLGHQPKLLGQDGWSCLLFPRTTTLLGVRAGRVRNVRTLCSSASARLDDRLDDAARELSGESLRSGIGLTEPVRLATAWMASPAPRRVGPVTHGGLAFQWVAELQWRTAASQASDAQDRQDAEAAACLPWLQEGRAA